MTVRGMPQLKNAFEVFQLLEKSNCGNCGEKTCLAFAGAVFRGQRCLAECPRVDRSVVERYSGELHRSRAPEAEGAAHFEKLKAEVAQIDLAGAAKRTGGRFAGDRLTLKVLGKDFSVDRRGNIYTDIHVNPWVAIPFLTHILHGKGRAPMGRWVPFRELKTGREGYSLFRKRCEEPLKRIADSYTPLFDDMVHLLGGKQVERRFASDVSVVLHPLPLVPIMVCYWLPEEGMQSSLNVFFDDTANDNLDISAAFALGSGLAQMFAKIAQRHGLSTEKNRA
jgi:hypothetical protein